MNPEDRETRRYRLIQAFVVLGSGLISIGCALLIYVAVAEAGEYGPGRPFGEPELAALAQAEAYWGQQPALCMSLSVEVVAPGALGVNEEGGDVGGRATQPISSTPCGMWIEEDELGRGLCSLIRHEYGHWLGFGHEDAELAQLPACIQGSDEASGGVYVPPNPKRVARQQAWDLFREWRAGCREEPNGSRSRQRCFAAAHRYAKRMRHRWS